MQKLLLRPKQTSNYCRFCLIDFILQRKPLWRCCSRCFIPVVGLWFHDLEIFRFAFRLPDIFKDQMSVFVDRLWAYLFVSVSSCERLRGARSRTAACFSIDPASLRSQRTYWKETALATWEWIACAKVKTEMSLRSVSPDCNEKWPLKKFELY